MLEIKFKESCRWSVLDTFPVTIYALKSGALDSLEHIEYMLWAKLQVREAARSAAYNVLYREHQAGRLSLKHIAKSDLETHPQLRRCIQEHIRALRTAYEGKRPSSGKGQSQRNK